jgi:microcystin-dependent protein
MALVAALKRRSAARAFTTNTEEYPMGPLLGEIRLFPYDFAPRGWEFCQGQIIPIRLNQPLFALLGTTHGGDGVSNFALPNLKGKEPTPGLQYAIAVVGEFPRRD